MLASEFCACGAALWWRAWHAPRRNNGVETSLLSDPDRYELDSICRIYSAAIPRCEQDPLSDLRDWVWRADQRLLVARRAGAIIGFSSLYLAREFSFLE